MMNVLIFGPPGSGKGTQSEKIIKKYGFLHVSTGELLRYEMGNYTQLGAIAKRYIDEGDLVPDDLIIDMIDHKLEKLYNHSGLIFDGFPRTVAQADALKEILRLHKQEVSVMINLNVKREILVERLLNRGITSERSDDNMRIITKRLDVYEERTKPVIQFYKKENKLVDINGIGEMEEVFANICKAIDAAK
jgi:adenylate kinase